MDERDLERLLNRYADQLSDEELDAAIPPEMRERLDKHVDRRSRESSMILRVAVPSVLGLAACVAFILFVLIPREPALEIERFVLASERVRTPSVEQGELRLGLALNRSAYVRVIAFDTRHERQLVPLDDVGGEFVRQTEGMNVRFQRVQRPDDPRGPAEVLFVMVVVSPGTSPTVEELLQSIPERIAPQTEDVHDLARALEQTARELESRFDCVVRVRAVPDE